MNRKRRYCSAALLLAAIMAGSAAVGGCGKQGDVQQSVAAGQQSMTAGQESDVTDSAQTAGSQDAAERTGEKRADEGQTAGSQDAAKQDGKNRTDEGQAADSRKNENQTEDSQVPEVRGLAELYQENFPVGIALPNYVFENIDTYEEVITDNFNSITCENEMKPDYLLDKAACQADLEHTYLNPAVKFDTCQPAIEFALAHDMKIRLHTLVWHSQTPKWFFTEDYTENGKLVSREVMLARMEHYIAAVLGYFQENYPGLIYAVDVVNEAFDIGNGDENGVRRKDNLWYETVGDDYYYQAFVFARKYASEDMKLFYNDYGCMDKVELILEHLKQAKEEGLIDGIGMQSHLSISDRIQYKFMLAVKEFCKAGYEVQATELDIGVEEAAESDFLIQGRKYRSFFKNMKLLQEDGYAVTGVTVWGLNDKLSWRKGEYGLLFDEDMKPKKAYLGAMLDSSVPDVE